jgi:Mn2+/Fe2+ NRAMP family transporter
MQMVTGVRAYFWTPLFACAIVGLLFLTSYRAMARVLKWLTLVLFAYVIAAFLARPDWSAVLRATFIPHIEWTKPFMSVLVGIFGTTISPYLFFWQAAEEVEEDREHGKTSVAQRRGSTDEELAIAKKDVITGMAFSNLVMYFIILTTAATLHAHGITKIDTAQQAAEALRPLAGQGAYWLFTLGLIGTGMLAVPVLAGSCAYAIAESARWRSASLNRKPHQAYKFYAVIAISVLVGLAFNYAGFNAVKMLFWSAVLNGVLAPPLVILIVLLTSDSKVMGKRTNSPRMRMLAWLCAGVMTAAALALLVL